ncbi:alpha/beta fold hydrolase, partial [Rhizobium sp. YK2]|uniref:thioesterase domain-containing protein n=1 Tax=Rhizobium sp. YK2 TaxID=1860096 RepID=UPI000A859BB6
RLVAYIVPTAEASVEPGELAAQLRAHLAACLPDYMVPAAFVRLEDLPLTPNGKLDRKALPSPEGEAYARRDYEAPQGEVEQTLAAIWSELLGLERVSRHDHFFELGGHSLLAAQLTARSGEIGLEIPVNTIFKSPVLSQLAQYFIEKSQTKPNSGQISLNIASVDKPSVFVMPAIVQPSDQARYMLAKLERDYKIHIIPWKILVDQQSSTTEAIAARIVSNIRSIQAQGPYRLISFRTGQIFSHAVAQHLLGLDENISFFGFIDVEPTIPNWPIKPVNSTHSNDEHLNEPSPNNFVVALHKTNTAASPAQELRPTKPARLLPANTDILTEGLAQQQRAHLEKIAKCYEASPLNVAVHHFCNDDSSSSKHKSFDLPVTSVERVSLHQYEEGQDEGVIHDANGEQLARALRSQVSISKDHVRRFDPLIPLAVGDAAFPPIICVPGAGASVTSFMQFVGALDSRLSIYGLQPRGIDPSEGPHESVHAAAIFNLPSIESLQDRQPLHLIGHSHGGLVAFEMACLLQAKGREVASLTLIDSAPPDPEGDTLHDITETQIFREFVNAISFTLDEDLHINEAVMESGRRRLLLDDLHRLLRSKGVLPQNSESDSLRGALNAFAAARRGAYFPAKSFAGTMRLVQVTDPTIDVLQDSYRRRSQLTMWRRWVNDLEIWAGPGHHFSILREPNAAGLAEWWQESVGLKQFDSSEARI